MNAMMQATSTFARKTRSTTPEAIEGTGYTVARDGLLHLAGTTEDPAMVCARALSTTGGISGEARL